MSKGFSCNFLDLAVRQSPQGLSCDIFEKRSQPEYAGIEMIRMPHVHSNISMTPKLGVISSQFYRFLRLCSCRKLFCLSDGCSYWLSEGKRLPFFNSSENCCTWACRLAFEGAAESMPRLQLRAWLSFKKLLSCCPSSSSLSRALAFPFHEAFRPYVRELNKRERKLKP